MGLSVARHKAQQVGSCNACNGVQVLSDEDVAVIDMDGWQSRLCVDCSRQLVNDLNKLWGWKRKAAASGGGG